MTAPRTSRLSAATPSVGRVIAEKYELVKALAEGGMGAVYIARHVLTRAEFALKILHSEAATDEASVERFLREVRFAAEIGHPGIVKVFDAGEDSDGTLFLAMERLIGEDLAARLARPETKSSAALDILFDMLSPLAAAHERSIVHRDLKPENVFLARDESGRERVKLLDFGIARQVGVSSTTSAGMGLGTTHYMSPEQAMNARDVRPASDIWAMGVMMYEAIAGVLPFDGESVHAVVIAACTQPHPSLAAVAPQADPQFVALVDHCLQKKYLDRPQNARELAALLEPLLRPGPVRATIDRVPATRARKAGPDEARPPTRSGLTSRPARLPSLGEAAPISIDVFEPPSIPQTRIGPSGAVIPPTHASSADTQARVSAIPQTRVSSASGAIPQTRVSMPVEESGAVPVMRVSTPIAHFDPMATTLTAEPRRSLGPIVAGAVAIVAIIAGTIIWLATSHGPNVEPVSPVVARHVEPITPVGAHPMVEAPLPVPIAPPVAPVVVAPPSVIGEAPPPSDTHVVRPHGHHDVAPPVIVAPPPPVVVAPPPPVVVAPPPPPVVVAPPRPPVVVAHPVTPPVVAHPPPRPPPVEAPPVTF